MAFYADEEEVWKCPKHPSKRRRSGICPTCLRERLTNLCPDCANVRPCACCTSSSSSSSSSFSFFSSSSSAGDASRSTRVGSVGRLSNLIDSEPAFRRSRSLAIPFLHSRFAEASPPVNRRKSSFWSVFRTQKSKECEEEREDGKSKIEIEAEEKYAHQMMMMRSRSVSVPVASDSGAGNMRSSSVKSRGLYFPSPIKFFRQSKTSKVVQERSPLYRG